ncbi:MAG: carboxylating nicotinate-nucleotide diphosphorylase, partial [Xanthomonadaceae bacterium]|nr:carboxylating nicotinate-nucleotide diphosphorylase [Xanthomonadaceae bacterium]
MKKNLIPLPDLLLRPYVEFALFEDLGRRGDVTSYATIDPSATASLQIVARKAGIIAGLALARLTFDALDPNIKFTARVNDGEKVAPGTVLADVSGNAQALLTAERTALNFLTHLSGIASQTGEMVELVSGTNATITCTRKTIPGMRSLQKYAVRAGGGRNHRLGLDDAILIKDNHVAIAGGIKNALTQAKEVAGHLIPLEVEVDTLEQLNEALEVGVDLVLLDNMTLDEMREAVALCQGKVRTEASGGINPDTVRGVAETGVDFIAMGWLTHTAPSL